MFSRFQDLSGGDDSLTPNQTKDKKQGENSLASLSALMH